MIEQQNIDAVFALMAEDTDYQDGALGIIEEFAQSDAEARGLAGLI